MAYVALYRKWRPMTFDEVVEQKSVVEILKRAVTEERIAHAYLFCGTRGTGKTTIAKIFARAVNCQNSKDGNPCNECAVCKGIINQQILDVSEIDAASNNGVDNIRSIIEETTYSSSVAKYRVYIIDEVHMLSSGAFNALLKTLEEPPKNVIFILATTEPHKLPVTILSRCQRYDFKRISMDGIIARLKEICKASGIEAEESALGFLAEKSDGAMRDAISLLDQTIAGAGSHITLSDARTATGSLDKNFIMDIASAIVNSDGENILRLSHSIFTEGRDPSAFIVEMITIFRNMVVVKTVSDPTSLIYEDADGIARLKEISQNVSVRELSRMIEELSALENTLKWAIQRQIVFEAGLLSLCDRKWSSDADLLKRVELLENRISDLVAQGIKVAKRDSYDQPKVETKQAPMPSAGATSEPKDTQSVVRTETSAVSKPKLHVNAEKLNKDFDFSNIEESLASLDREDVMPTVAKETQTTINGSWQQEEAMPIDELDWNDFLSNASHNIPINIMAFINRSQGYFRGNDIVEIRFTSKFSYDQVCVGKFNDALRDALVRATGKTVSIVFSFNDSNQAKPNMGNNIPVTRSKPVDPALSANIPTSRSESAKPATSFDDISEKLKSMSQDEGFEIEFN